MAYFDKYGVEYSDDRKTLVMFPQNFKGAYVIPEGVTDFKTYTEVDGEDLPFDVYVEYSPFTYQPLKRHAISCCPGLTSLEFPSSLTVIPEMAFQGCCSLETVIFHAKELTIEDYAFDGCEKLENVIIETDDIHIGSNVFRETQFIKSHCIDGALYFNDTLIFVDSAYNGVFVVKEGTKRLGKSVFAYIEGITEVVLPKSLEDLGIESFSHCGIRKICIPEGITKIQDGGDEVEFPDVSPLFCKDGVFGGCKNLEEVVLPTSLKEIGVGAFYGCTKLSTINIPQGVQRIGMFAFEGTWLYSISIKNPSVIIENGAFANCHNLTEVKFDEFSSPQFVVVSGQEYGCSAELSPESVFANCENLPVIDNIRYAGNYLVEAVDKELSTYIVKDDTKHIGVDAFRNCCCLKAITIPDSVISIGEGAFEKCAVLNSIIIPDNVTKIGSGAFCNCSNLTSVTIGNGVTNIESNAFYDCQSLISVIIGKGVENIRNYAFSGCSNLKSLSIPDNVMSIEEGVFCDCKALNKPIYNAHVFAYLPRTYSGEYVIPSGINLIANHAFSRCNYLTSVVIPSSVKSIGGDAFSCCENLTSLTIPDGVTNIGDSAFSYCTRLTSVTIPNSVTKIGWNVFNGCEALNTPMYNAHIFAYFPRTYSGEYVIPLGIKTIANYAFYRCKRLTSVIIPNSVTCIEEDAFDDCESLVSIEIPNSVTHVGWDAFGWNAKWNTIIVPLGEEERFCEMDGLKNYADIIRQTSEKRKQQQQQRDEYEQRLLQEQQRQELFQGTILFFDTETNGLPRNYKASVSNSSNWPRLVQLAWIIADKEGNVLKKKSVIIKPDGFSIPADAVAVHGITTERAQREGIPLTKVLEEFAADLIFAQHIVGHNIDFDQHVVGAELCRLGMDFNALIDKPCTCTMKTTTNFCAIPNPNTYFGGYKWPSLQELYRKLFNRDFEDAHDALADITATKECFFELKRRGIIQ